MIEFIKRKKTLLILSLAYSLLLFSDIGLVRKGFEPIFSPIITVSNTTKFRIGFLYYFSEEISISPTQPLSHSPEVRVGIWFARGIRLYTNTYDE